MRTVGNIKVIQDEEKPVEVSVLAKAIVDISDAAQRLSKSGLNRKAVVVLLAHHTGLGQIVVRTVLDGIDELKSAYLK